VIAFALVNAGWAAGQLAGGTIAAALAQATTENVPYIAIAVLFAVTLITQMRRPRTERCASRSRSWARARAPHFDQPPAASMLAPPAMVDSTKGTSAVV
jgi:hypothetical protein